MSTAVCVALFLTCLPCVISSDVSFTVTPNAIQHLVTDKLLMRCALPIDPAIVRSGTSSGQPASLDQHRDDVTPRSGSVSDIKHVSSVVITRNNKDIAMVSVYEPARGFENTTGLQVSGQVSANGQELGYLEVSYNNPGPDQKGSYTCDINGFDQHGHAVILTKTIEVLESEVTTRDLVKYIHQLHVTNLQQNTLIASMNTTIVDSISTIANMNTTIVDSIATIANLSTTIQDHDHQHTATVDALNKIILKNTATIDTLSKTIKDLQIGSTASIDAMNSTIADISTAVQDLKTHSIANINSDIGNIINNVSKNLVSITTMTSAINDHSVNINKLTTKLNTTVIFSAGISSSVTVSDGHTLIFDKVIFSVGGGYNSATGIFTCPVAGIYLFHLHVTSQDDKEVYVYIRHNSHSIVMADADDQFDNQAASNSVTLRLAVGDTVDVYTGLTSYPQGSSQPFNTFTGQLVAMD